MILRKAQSDGATILFDGKEYRDLTFDGDIRRYSIEEKGFTPVLKRSLISGRIVCFMRPTKGIVIDDNGSVEYDVGEIVKNFVSYDNELHWGDVR